MTVLMKSPFPNERKEGRGFMIVVFVVPVHILMYVMFLAVHLLDEAVQMMNDGAKSIQDGVTSVRQRLQHRSPVVKSKALRLVKHTMMKGSPDLKRAFTRELSAAVRELTHFRCAPDPFKGDIPWKRVQQSANDVLETLHAAPNSQHTTAATNLGSRIQGFGSDSQGKSSMVGFGSDSLSNSNQVSVSGYSSGILNADRYSSTSKTSMLDALASGVSGMKDKAMYSLTGAEHRRLDSRDKYDVDSFFSGRNDEYTPSTKISSTVANSTPIANASNENRLNQTTGVSKSATGAPSSSIEERLVLRICQPKGLRAVPSSDELRLFVEQSKQLNGSKIAATLHETIENGNWQESLRALCALEALLEISTTTPVAGEVAVYFQVEKCMECLRRSLQSNQMTIRQRSNKIMTLLGHETLDTFAKGQQNAGTVKKSEQLNPDLLDGISDVSWSQSNRDKIGKSVDLLSELDNPASTAVPGSSNDFLTTSDTAVSMQQQSIEPRDPFGDWMSSTADAANDGMLSSAHKGTKTESADVSNCATDFLEELSGLNLNNTPLNTSSGTDILGASFDTLPGAIPSSSLSNSQPLIFTPQGAELQKPSNLSYPVINNRNLGTTAPPVALGAQYAATSGINSSQRGDAAFEGLVSGAIESMKKKGK